MQHPKFEEFLVVLPCVPWMKKISGFVLSFSGYSVIPPTVPIERYGKATLWGLVVGEMMLRCMTA